MNRREPNKEFQKPQTDDRFINEQISPSNINKYEKLRLLGDGTFSQVYECLELKTDNKFAIKIVSKSFLLKHDLHEQFTKEIRIHSELDHPNIVKLIKVFENQYNIYMVLELVENGTLADLIEKRKHLSEFEIKYYIKNLLDGINYIHQKNIIHRDLKPANLILTKNMDIKIADFGLAAYAPKTKRKRKTFCGTPYYIAPEIITKEGHLFEVDYWSLGIIIFNMAYGVCPFQSEVPEEVYKMVLKGYYEVNKYSSKELNEVINILLERDITKRANYDSLKNSKFLNDSILIKSLPLSTLETAPSESFISSLQQIENRYEPHRLGQIQQKFYAKSDSKNSLGVDENLTEKVDYEYLKKWVNFSEKFGVCGIFNNGIICIYFNDKSKIVLSNFGITFNYIGEKSSSDGSIETFNVLKYPKEIEKKVKLLEYFIKFLRVNSDLIKVNENMPDNFVHITNFKITKYAVCFALSNRVYQTIFQDKTEVHIFKDKQKQKTVVYIDTYRNRITLEPGTEIEEGIKKRLEHVNECLKCLSSKNETE